ncbi:hypothetical protein [Terrabacter sp. NPDC080008]|uniref:hypothetical protein n=1 Tax=Terrabacter sp. NPDC080008 TaxID=3155176 RepID=UPI00344B9B23
MTLRAESCGLAVGFDSSSRAWSEVADRAFGGASGPGDPAPVWAQDPARTADVAVRVEDSHDAFDLAGLAPLTRGAFGDGRRVVLTDACGSGLDLLVEPSPGTGRLTVTARPRPRPSHRALRLAAPGRTELLWRAALLQYPALWWAGVRGCVPLHVSAAQVGDHGVVLAGPGGVGKSTLLASLAPGEGTPVSDNLCAYDGDRLHGLPEPRRVSEPGGARLRARTMPHGRVERRWDSRQSGIRPTLVVVLRRGSGERPVVRRVSPEVAARDLVAGTYAAGELRRYWAFSATLALGTGLGPAHPAIDAQAERLARSHRCVEVELPARPGTPLAEIVDLAERAPGRHAPRMTEVGA